MGEIYGSDNSWWRKKWFIIFLPLYGNRGATTCPHLSPNVKQYLNQNSKRSQSKLRISLTRFPIQNLVMVSSFSIKPQKILSGTQSPIVFSQVQSTFPKIVTSRNLFSKWNNFFLLKDFSNIYMGKNFPKYIFSNFRYREFSDGFSELYI